MGRERCSFWVITGVLLAASSGGCGGAEPSPSAGGGADEVGTISLPLITETDGHRYRLSQALLSVSGPQFIQLASSDDPGETALSATLQTGNYFAILYSWVLERDDGTGRFLPVQADLVSGQYANFSIFDGATTTLRFRFRTDGVIVEVGAGELRVDVAVDEVTPACTLFAAEDGCSPGHWCAPSGLTGLPRACVRAGSIELGQACLGATDCVAGAACRDAGAGPICTALCASSEAGSACPTGGTCRIAASDYGVCGS